MKHRLHSLAILTFLFFTPCSLRAQEAPVQLDRDLIAYWPLAGDTNDHSGNGYHALIHGSVDLEAAGPSGNHRSAAGFNGLNAWLEVPAGMAPNLPQDSFTSTAWIHTSDSLDDVPGDIVSQYDQAQRSGFHLSLKTNAVTTSLANDRHLHFGIDNDRASSWSDCGRPGNALLAFALTVHDGALYAGTCETEMNESGHVYRYAGGKQWTDCSTPDRSNSVTALAVYNGQLYAGTGKYRVARSALPESENRHLGGRIFRHAGEDR